MEGWAVNQELSAVTTPRKMTAACTSLLARVCLCATGTVEDWPVPEPALLVIL